MSRCVFAIRADSGLARESEVLHYDGSSWKKKVPGPVDGGTYYLQDVWCAAANNVYASGFVELSDSLNGTSSAGAVFHFDGQSLANVLTDSSSSVYNAVWGTGPDNIYAVGTKVLHHRP